MYFNVRLDEERSCILVVIGANFQGEKHLLAVRDGYRESKQSWKEVLLELKHRGMEHDPKLLIGDGGLGLWAALPEVFPTTKSQRCWVHKTANVLDTMPTSVQGRAKAMLHDIYRADTKQNAENAIPHLAAGVMGRAFQTPFAKPRGKGLSSSAINVLWGFFNMVAAYLLVEHVGSFQWRATGEVVAFGLGFLLKSLGSARQFGKLHGGNTPTSV